MKEDVERMLRAYLDVYFRFHQIYYDELYNIDEVNSIEAAILFQTALNSKTMLSEMLKQEIIERYMQLKQEEEQAKQAEVEVPG